VKPLLGQLQNNQGLDELLNSSKPTGGNFGRPSSRPKAPDVSRGDESSFSEMLLATLKKPQQQPQTKKSPPDVNAPAQAPVTTSGIDAKRAFSEKIAKLNKESDASKQTSDYEKLSKNSEDRYEAKQQTNHSEVIVKSTRKTPDVPEQAGQQTSGSGETQGNQSSSQLLSRNQSMASKKLREPQTPGLEGAASPTVNQTADQSPVVPSQPGGLSPEQLNLLTMQATMPDNTSALPSSQAIDAITALSPLKTIMSGKMASDALINRNPVLAFVTGRLEKLDPETIPSLIAESPLIKQALASGDIADFMNKPMTIGDLSNLIELDQSLINKASQAGLDPSKLVTPKEFLQALGLDSSRIASELTILKQRLPLDGVAPYIQRAKALAASVGASAMQASAPLHKNKANKDAATQIMPSQNTKDLPTVEKPGLGDQNPQVPVAANTPKLGAQAKLVTPGMPITPDKALSQHANVGLDPLNDRLSSISKPSTPTLAESKAESTAILDPTEALIAQAIYAGVPVVSSEPMSSNLAKPNAPGLSDTSITARNVNSTGIVTELNPQDITGQNFVSDPYLEIGRQMDVTQTTKFEFGGDGFSARSIEENLLSRGYDPQPNQHLPQQDAKIQDLRGIERVLEELPQKFIPEFKPENEFGLTSTSDIPQMLTGSLPDLVTSSAEFSQEEGFSDGGSQSRDQGFDLTSNLITSKTETGKITETFTEKVAEAPKAPVKDSIASKIFGQAQMMFKNGGGSMRLDMEAPGIGKVDVAINLINNQLDVRIITSSEQARDMISKEVFGLREGLNQQGISLRGLEVGKAGENTPRQFAGQGQQFGQGAQQQRSTYNDMRDYAQSFRNSTPSVSPRSISPATTTLSRWSNPTNLSSGRLEVRV
jgi:hypothetical protein